MHHRTLFSQTLLSLLPRSAQTRTGVSRIALGLMALLALGLGSPTARAQTYIEQTVHAFAGGSDGATPVAALINVNGTLYGTTSAGGNSNKGTVFSYNPTTNTETTLYQFTGTGGDGATPVAALLNVNGTLYGTTKAGGTSSDGTVFSYNPTTNTETILHSFTSTDGVFPQASLILVNGVLYGTTENNGGTNDYGTIFSINPDGSNFQVIHRFIGEGFDGAFPYASLLNFNGLLYTTTLQGGNGGDGTIISIDPTTNQEQLLYTSQAYFSADGAGYVSNLINVNGTLYGTSYSGGVFDSATGRGTIYSFNPTTSREIVVYRFLYDGNSGGPGAYPRAGLIYDSSSGRLYGTAENGGSYTGRNGTDSDSFGTVFSFEPATNQEHLVYSFNNVSSTIDGVNPVAGLILVNGTLYGTASAGGIHGKGTIFSIKITAVAPVAGNDTYAPKYDAAYVVKAPGVLANDNDSGDPPMTTTQLTNPVHGTLSFNGDGSFIYTPNSGFLGTDSFTYHNTNSLGTSNTATVTFNVQPMAPVAHTGTYTANYKTTLTVPAPGVLTFDNPGDNGTITTKLLTQPGHGTLSFHTDGSFVYTPTAGYIGSDSFTYNATNAIGTSNTAPVNIMVQPVAPIAANDTYAPQYATAYAVKAPGVLANDDTGGTTPITAVLVSNPAHGSLTFNSDGSFTYTPSAGFAGTDTFTYQASNSAGMGNTATVSLVIQTSAPKAGNDAYAVAHNTLFRVHAPGVLANDYAGDSGSLIAVQNSQPSHGTLTFSNDGSFTYVPNAGYSGTDGFSYFDSNAIGASNIATVILTVQ